MSNDFFQFISVFTEKKAKAFYAVQHCGFEGLFADFISWQYGKQQIFCILCHLALFGIIFLSERLFIQSRIIVDFEFIKIKTEVLS